MSFVWKSPDGPLRTETEVAREVHSVSVERELTELASVMALMCIRQESNFWCPWNAADPTSKNYPYDSQSDDGRSVAYFQQQNKVPGENPTAPGTNWWGPMSCRMDLRCSTNTFLSRLPDDYARADTPHEAALMVQRVQGSFWDGVAGHPGDYAKHWDYCWNLLHVALLGDPSVESPATEPPETVKAVSRKPNPGWRGDPLWLPDVLQMFGVSVSTFTDAEGVPWDQRGHGDFDRITWVLWHHTGNVNETDVGIAHHPSLGLAANMLVHPDGHTVLTGSGIAWHGGYGIYPGIPEDGINQLSIGIECAHSGQPGDPWPEKQKTAMLNIGGAISWFLGSTCPPDHQIAHKEWAGAQNPLGINKQGKPDPIDIDMNWFRQEVGRRAAAGPTTAIGGPGEPTTGQEVDIVGVSTDRLNKAIDKIIGGGSMPTAWDSRSIFAKPGGVDDTVGMLLHTDGNGHTEKVIIGALIGYPEYVADVQRVAREGPAKGSYAAAHYPAQAQAFAKTLAPLCGKLASLLDAVPLTPEVEGDSGSAGSSGPKTGGA